MNPNHTPGPWTLDTTVYEHDEEYGDSYRSVSAGSHSIANVIEHFHGDDTDMSNARLIAAAPDLLGACRAFMAACKREELTDKIAECYEITRSIVRKATGPEL